MATRYRFRVAKSTEPWSEPVHLRRIMAAVRTRQERHGKPFRWRRRDREWKQWFNNARHFRIRFRFRIARARHANYQVQFDSGKVTLGVLKFKLPPPELSRGEQVIEAAKGELGTPYRFGEANGPEDPGTDGYDCSGLTQWAWANVGVTLPHSAEAQRLAPNVTNFESEDVCQVGDLVFFWFSNSRGISPGHASHVGLWLRPGFVIDTRSQTSPVAIRVIEQGSVIGYGRPYYGRQQ